ncbi:MAG: DUF3422 domain-containing protein [Sulfitobacter sp.]
MSHITDHPLRYALTNELHARPFPTLEVPCIAAYLAIKPISNASKRDRTADMAHLVDLLKRHGTPCPPDDATHFSGQIGQHWLKWESHTEFVTYTTFSNNVGTRPFDPNEFEVFPKDWLGQAPSARITSALIRIIPSVSDEQLIKDVTDWFVPESAAVAQVLGNAATIAGDFRIDQAGHLRFLVCVNPDVGDKHVGRIVQSLCEIETYKAMSMLGFSRVRTMSARMGHIDDQLGHLMKEMTSGNDTAEDTLDELLEVSAELETMAVDSSFRFGATEAYAKIVDQRISSLREERLAGRQTFAEFMTRRFEPAMRTVEATQKRLGMMADRAMRASDLLRTRVDVTRSAQNQALLENMDKRADLQLRLQKTVEGLSTVAISYYAVSLLGYLLFPLSVPLGISKALLTAAITLPVILAVWWMVRRLRKKIL